MRPEDFSPGNRCAWICTEAAPRASMRPEDFSPGNRMVRDFDTMLWSTRFNEAGGFLPRKHGSRTSPSWLQLVASMRPEDFSPGNWRSAIWSTAPR